MAVSGFHSPAVSHPTTDASCNPVPTAVEFVTPPLGDMILPGVTRDSILSLLRDHESGKNRLEGLPEKLVVSERELTSEYLARSNSLPSPNSF